MTPDPARNRWLIMNLVRIAFVGGAIGGLLLYARHPATEVKVIAGLWVLVSIYCMTMVPKALAHRWRTPPEA